ncbi:uncharacterized protein LOC135470746 [Liolophura sinensis]|uniref:uncharacterized protein LOC135470746 n=1 Tax=Liolophura sinensis TaxID=3198878 RepID=UPI00315814E5
MVKEVFITLAGNKQVYRAGELVSGECILELTEPETAKAVSMYFYGRSMVKWEDVEIGIGHFGHAILPKPKTVNRESREDYFAFVLTLWGSKNGPKSELPPGTHRWKFNFKLPQRPLPSSFEGEHGAIRYWLKIEIHKPFPWPNFRRYRCITVLDDLNLNAPHYSKPVRGSNSKIISKMLGFGNVGTIKLIANTDRRGYAPGEKIGICATMVNDSAKVMDGSRAKLIQRAQYFASGKEKTVEKTVAEIYGAEIPKGVTMKWEWECMTLGCLPPSSRSGSCHILRISYYIKMFIAVPFGFDLHVHLPVVIGTVPRGYRSGVTPGKAPVTSYAKCNQGFEAFPESDSVFPNIDYTPMTAFVPNFRFTAPVPGQKPALAPVTAKATPKKTSSLPAVSCCCLVIRFLGDQLPILQSSLRANKSTLEDLGATVIGVTDKVAQAEGYPWNEGQGLALIVFPTKDKAKDWVSTTPEVSDHDWLEGADITLFTMREANKPDISEGFFSIELTKCSRSISQEEITKLGRVYTPKSRAARGLHGGALLISAGSKSWEHLRGAVVSSPNILTCLQWPSEGSYEKYLYSLQTEEYKEAMDFWSTLFRRESRVTLETMNMRWWSEESVGDISNTNVQTVKTQEKEDVETGVYFVIRFPFEKFTQFQDAIKEKKVLLKELKGRLVAMAPQIMTTEGTTWPVGKTLAIVRFKASEEAKQWFGEIGELPNTAWLSECDVLIVKMTERSHDDDGTFVLTTSTICLKKEYVGWWKELLEEIKAVRLKHDGVAIFGISDMKKKYERLQGDWLTEGDWLKDKRVCGCVQFPNAQAYFACKAELDKGKHADKKKQLIQTEQALLFETVDLCWLKDDDTEDMAGKDDEHAGENRVE